MVLVWQFCPFQNWQSLGQGEIPKGSVHKEKIVILAGLSVKGGERWGGLPPFMNKKH